MRIAIVNDLALAREILRRVVISVPGCSVAWLAGDGDEAVLMAARDRPDAILMDLVMPRMDGAEATRRIMRDSPCPVLVVTATVPGHFDLVYQAMGAGALDAVETPTFGPGGTIRNGDRLTNQLARIGAAAGARGSLERPIPPLSGLPPVVAIGSSTGGPDALATVLASLPADFPAAVLLAQHIAAEYAHGLAERLATQCRLPVRAAREGDALTPGVVLLAATNDHLALGPDRRLGYTAIPHAAPYRPSADVLFASLAAYIPRDGVGVLLTGMGTDGAEGLLRLRQAGWHTIAQDESSCVVYGMPRAAVEARAASEILPLTLIGPAIIGKIRASGH
jgi:two-component system response regulator WspF